MNWAKDMQEIDKIGVSVAHLAVKVGFCKTVSEARRAIKQGGLKLADRKVIDPFARLILKDDKWVLVENRGI